MLLTILSKIKLSDAAYVDFAIAGLLIPILLAYNKVNEALIMACIMIVYYMIAEKLFNYNR